VQLTDFYVLSAAHN